MPNRPTEAVEKNRNHISGINFQNKSRALWLEKGSYFVKLNVKQAQHIIKKDFLTILMDQKMCICHDADLCMWSFFFTFF